MSLIPFSKKYFTFILDVYGQKLTNKFTNRGIFALLAFIGLYRSHLYIYVDKNEIIGWGCINRKLNIKTMKVETWICGIYIYEAFRKQHHGTRMMQNIIQECRVRSYTQLKLYVDKNNIGACKLYEKLGFVKETNYNHHVYYKMLSTIQ